MGFLSWAKGVFNRLIGKKDIETALKLQTAVSDEMTDAISLWAAMYANSPPWKSSVIQTTNLPAVIASKFAKMVTIEAKCTMDDGPRGNWIKEQFDPVWQNIRNYTEFAAAKGGLVFKPYIADGKIIVDVVQADRIFPTAFDNNGKITGGIFVAQTTIGRDIYTRLERHEFTGNSYIITNTAYRSSAPGFLGALINLANVAEWSHLQPYTKLTSVTQPLFCYFKMPLANNIDTTSPMGVSVFSRAAGTIKELDKQYSRLLWEFEGGELAVHASSDLFKPERDKDKKLRPVLPEGKDRLYRVVDDGISDTDKLFEVYSPTLRDQSLLNGMNKLLQQIEQQCGFAFGTLSDPQSVDKTATEIINSKQESYSTVSDIQKALEAALRELLASIDTLGTAGKLAPQGSYKAAFSWDDSILVDKNERKLQFWQYVQAGKFPFWLYLKEFEGYTEDEARKIQTECSQAMGDPYATPRVS